MGAKLFVGNLPWSVDDDELRKLFAEHGELLSASVVTNRYNGRSRGFGFVEFESAEDAEAAITAMQGTEIDGRELNVDKAHARED